MDRKDSKKKAAEKRNAAWQALSTEAKLAVLATRPGMCAKQIAKLSGG